MHKEQQHIFQKRVRILAIFMFVLGCLLVGRLLYLQVFQSSKYQTLSDDNRINISLVSAPRGKIIDRKGRILADNKQIYQAVLNKRQIKSRKIDQTLASVADVLGLGAVELESLRKKIKKHPRHIPFSLKKDLSWEDVSKLELAYLDLPGVEIIGGTRRFYPYRQAAAHVTGYVSSPLTSEMAWDPSLVLPDALTGKNGLEKNYEHDLRGFYGKKTDEVNAYGHVVRTLSFDEPIPGKDILVTIDAELQSYMHQLLSKLKSAAAVAIDIHTGEVLGLASVPGFDPNDLVMGLSGKEWLALLHSANAPLTNKVITGLYSPASIMKLIVALSAFESDKVGESFQTFCKGHIDVGKHKFHCWKRGGHGLVRLHEAMIKSCDVYFYEIAKRMGHKPILALADRMGFVKKSGIDLPGEKDGFLVSPRWKRQHLKEGWYLGDTILLSIGQGRILSTPLQWAVMMAQIANGGYTLQPHLQQGQAAGYKSQNLNFSPVGRKLLLKTMDSTVNEVGGTGYRSRIKQKGFEMGGKTATSQVRRISMQERRDGIRRGKALPWELRDNSMFVGYAPVNNPRYAVAVLIEHGGWGSSNAAPIGRDLLLKVQQVMQAETLKSPTQQKKGEGLNAK